MLRGAIDRPPSSRPRIVSPRARCSAAISASSTSVSIMREREERARPAALPRVVNGLQPPSARACPITSCVGTPEHSSTSMSAATRSPRGPSIRPGASASSRGQLPPPQAHRTENRSRARFPLRKCTTGRQRLARRAHRQVITMAPCMKNAGCGMSDAGRVLASGIRRLEPGWLVSACRLTRPPGRSVIRTVPGRPPGCAGGSGRHARWLRSWHAALPCGMQDTLSALLSATRPVEPPRSRVRVAEAI